MRKKAIRTVTRFETSKAGKVARREFPIPESDRAYILDGTGKAGDNTPLGTEAHNAAKICHRRRGAIDGAQLNGSIQHRGFL
jgi:hypothetical protein